MPPHSNSQRSTNHSTGATQILSSLSSTQMSVYRDLSRGLTQSVVCAESTAVFNSYRKLSAETPESSIRYSVDLLIPSSSEARNLFPPQSFNTRSTCCSMTFCNRTLLAAPAAGSSGPLSASNDGK